MQPHEVGDDMAALSPEACDYVRQLARRLDDAEHGTGISTSACAASRMHWRIRLRSARVMRASSLSSPPVIISRAVPPAPPPA